jgi:hypothetical protein
MIRILIIIYLLAIILSNYIAYCLGQNGLIITAFILIPFDYIIRTIFQEKWKGKNLIIRIIILIFLGGLITFIINYNTINIAIGSLSAFIIANILASIFYQLNIKKKYIYKVNISDFIAIIADSFIFQYLAFNNISLKIMISQISIKIIGGLFWYWLLFKKYKLQDKWL